MMLVLVFLAGVAAVAFFWLGRQGVMSKPWLETGLGMAPPSPIDAPRVGLAVFLVVVGALFVLFGSAFVMRMDLEPWSAFALPDIVWFNTVLLVIASVFMHRAGRAERHHDQRGQYDSAIAILAAGGFLAGQGIAWSDVSRAGGGLTAGPASSFFYLLSGLHGLHVIGGLVALGLVLSRDARNGERGLGHALCIIYWDFLLIVWLGLLVLFMGWANRFVDICRGALT